MKLFAYNEVEGTICKAGEISRNSRYMYDNAENDNEDDTHEFNITIDTEASEKYCATCKQILFE